MIIKEISTKNKDLFIIRDLKKDYKNQKKYNPFIKSMSYADFEKSELEYFIINKKYNLLDYEIIEV